MKDIAFNQENIEVWEQALRAVAQKQLGCIRYTSTRPVRIPGRLQGYTLGECLARLCPHVPAEQWVEALQENRLQVDGRAMAFEESAFGAMEISYTVHGRTEPEVATDIEVIAIDESLVVLQKPAPLPVHPCGRFNKNTLLEFIGVAWPGENLRPAHRIDAATTGLLVLTRNKEAAHFVQSQFANREVKKTYLVRVEGTPHEQVFGVDARIDLSVGDGGRRKLSDQGAAAHTDFEVVRDYKDGTTLLRASPISGRTNQIRLHLQSCGLPIVGDNAYGREEDVDGGMVSDEQTLHLHAHGISFRHPQGHQVSYESKRPDWAHVEP